MKTIAVIPARMGSSRFPGKPLAPVCGIPMIGHVWKRVALALGGDHTFVATCDREIFDYIESVGGRAVMTADSHERCTDRTAEALHAIEAGIGPVEVVVMVQGDEPLVTPAMIDASVAPLAADPEVMVVNLMGDLKTLAEFDDPNEVKVVVDANSDALYFSREPIPSRKKGAAHVPMKKQVCIIPFRREALLMFNELPPTPLEIVESVDMLRLLEHGYKVRMVPTADPNIGVDTPADLAVAEALMEADPVFAAYRDAMSQNREGGS